MTLDRVKVISACTIPVNHLTVASHTTKIWRVEFLEISTFHKL